MSDLKIQGEVSLSAESAENALDRVGDRAGKMATRLQTEADKAGKAVDGIGSGAEQSAQQFTRAEGRISDSIKRATKNLENLGKTASQKLEIQISEKGLDASKFEPALKKLRELEAAQNSVNTSAKKIPSAYDDITRSLGGMVTAAAALAAVGGSISKLVSIQREFDVLNASLVTMTGSAKNAGIAFGALQQFAATTPFSLQEVTGAFVKLKSLGLDPSQRALESYGNTASAMGKSLDQFIEAVADASTGEFERLKEFGIKASKSGDQVSLTFQGITTTIKNSSDQITEYLTKIGENQFAGAMAERAKTLDGAISNLSDSWNNLFLTVNQNATGTLIYDTVSLASGAVSDLTKIINAMTVAANENANSVGAMATVQDGIRTTFEAVAVVGANVAYVFKAIGTEIGGLAAQAAAVAQGDFASAGAIGDMMKEDAKKAREEIDALSERILNAGKVATVTSKSLDDLVAKAGSAVARSGSAAGSSTAKQISDYARLVASIKEKISVQNIELATGEKANEGEKLRAQIIEQTLSGQLKLTAAQKESVLAMAAELDAKISVAAANKEIAAAQEKFTADAMKSAESIYKQATEQEKANAVFGKAKSSVQELTLAEMERALQMQLMSGEYVPGLVDAMESQIDAQKRLIAAMQEGENLETGKKMAEESKKAAEDTAKEWQKTADKINDSLTDALMRGFENGKGFAENMRDTIVNMFKTMVLRPVIQATVQGGLNAVGLGSAQGGGTINGIGGAINTANSMNSIYAAGIQFLYGSSVGASAASLAAGNMAGMVGGDALGTMIAANGSWAGVSVGTASGTAAAGTAAAGGAGSAFASAVPIIGGIAAAIIAATALYKMISGETRGGGSYAWGSSTMNGAAGTYDDVTYIHGPSGGEIASDAVKEAITNTIGGINDVLESVGSTLTLAGFQAALETSGKGRGGVLAGGTLSDGTTFGEAGTGSNYAGTFFEKWSTQSPGAETALNNLATDLQQATLQALMAAADVPKSVKNIIGDIDIEAMTADETTALLTSVSTFISGVNALRTTLDYMPISNLQDATFEVIGSLVEIAGGVDSLTTSIDTYYQSYYSEAERMAASTDQLSDAFAVLGYTMPETKEAFRALVEGIDLTTEAGRESYMSLIGLSSAFAQVADYATSAADAAEQAAAAIEQAAAAQLASITGWQDQIDLLLGNVTQTQLDRRNALDAALSPAEQDLINQYYNLVELNDAVTAAQAALQSAQSAQVDALNSNISALQDQATTASALAKEMASAADSLSKYLTSLQASTGSPEQQLDAAKAAFETTAKKAMLGDTDAMGELTSLADAYLSLSKESASSLDQYARDQAEVERALKQSISVAERQSDLAQSAADSAAQQISLLQSQIDALSTVNGSVLSVAAAVQALADAQANLDNATQATALYQQIQSDYERYFDMAAVGDSMSWAGGTLTRTDAGAEYTDPTGVIVDLVRNASITALAATNDYLAQSWVKQYGSLPAFASGGYHTGGIRLVGENGPELEVTGPSRIYSASDTRALLSGGSDELVSEIKSLRAEVASLRASSESTARNTYQSRKLQERWDGDGMPEVRAA